MLYIGLFSVIIIIVLNFMLSTQEASTRNIRKAQLNQSSEFVTQHINYSFNKALSINETNSVLGDSQGILELEFVGINKQYTISNNTLYFDGVEITPPNIIVSGFLLEPAQDKDGVLIGVRTTISLVSQGDSDLTDTINMLFTLR